MTRRLPKIVGVKITRLPWIRGEHPYYEVRVTLSSGTVWYASWANAPTEDEARESFLRDYPARLRNWTRL